MPLVLVLALFSSLSSCKKDDEDDDEDDPIEENTPSASATIDGNNFSASQGQISSALSSGQYQIYATQDPEQISIFMWEEPSVQTYQVNDSSDVSIFYFEDELNSGSRHDMIDGTLEVTSYEDGFMKAKFSGTMQKALDPDVEFELTNGKIEVKLPN